MKVLVVTTEPCPFADFPTTGAGLRAWGLAEGLKSAGVDAEVAMAADGVARVDAKARERVADFVFDREGLTEHVRRRGADALVMQHWGLMNRLGETGLPIAIDLHGPHLLERRYWGSGSPDADLREKLEALARADFLTCAGRMQRHYFLPFAMLAGFAPTDTGLLGLIPFSVSPELPEERAERDWETLVYSGVFLPWQDPSAALETAAAEMERRGRGRLLVIGGAHPGGQVATGRFDALLGKLRESDRVTVEALKPSEEFERTLAGCGGAIDLMARNPERELAFTSRTVVYMAAGLPVLYNDYSELSAMIEHAEAGWCVSPEDGEGIGRTIGEMVGGGEELRRRGRNARELVRRELTWDRTIGPLAEWCERPRVRDGKRVWSAPDRAMEERVRELEGRRLVRFSEWLRKLGLR